MSTGLFNEPSAHMIQVSHFPFRLVSNTISLPSRDQAGDLSSLGLLVNGFCHRLPFRSITKISQLPVRSVAKTTFSQSWDQAGSTSFLSLSVNLLQFSLPASTMYISKSPSLSEAARLSPSWIRRQRALAAGSELVLP